MDILNGGQNGAMLFVVLSLTAMLVSAHKPWLGGIAGNDIDVTGPHPKSKVESLEVVCNRDHMTVHLQFSHPFYGVVFSHAEARHERCVHVGPKAGVTSTSFQIRYDTCGTAEDLGGRFHENTIVIQFGEDILEAWDEAKRLRCEWLESFEKPSSKPTLAISDLDVVELNFQGDDIDCWMEVQEGKGPWSRKVGGLVPIGSPLTLVIAINDHSREFDMRIKRCTATDGKGSEIELTDHNGCVLRQSLLTPFAKVKDLSPRATLVAYSHIHAFKFPDKIDVFVHCIVEVCRHGCPDSCGHQAKEYFHPRGPTNSLESKKHQLLVQLAQPIPQSQPFPSQQGIGEVFHGTGGLLAESQSQVHKVSLGNTSLLSTVESQGKKLLVNRATFKPKSVLQAKQKTKSDNVGSASNVHGVFADVGNSLIADQGAGSSPGVHEPGHTTYHRIIGHDIHWIESNDKKAELNHAREPDPSLDSVSYKPSQPASWSADEVKPLTKQEVYLKQQGPHPGHAFFSADEVLKLAKSEAPQPEPAPWSAEDVTPLTRQQVVQGPQPEPAPWSFDDVKPLKEPEIVTPDVLSNVGLLHKVPHFQSGDVKTLHVGQRQPDPIRRPDVPQPEPAPWKFEEVNPMHIPEIFRQTRRPDEPQPEPGPWTLDNVKPISKEDLRLLSLNYKLRSEPHITLPTYQEFVNPYQSSTLPQPVYAPDYAGLAKNMSTGMNMKNMMMMMSTMLPQTYQTALWPQRATTRLLRPQKHHYPYPIPQFSPHGGMMMSVVADRRSDSEEDASLNHNLGQERSGGVPFLTVSPEMVESVNDSTEDSETPSTIEGKISVGETYKEKTKSLPAEDTDEPTFESSPTEALATSTGLTGDGDTKPTAGTFVETSERTETDDFGGRNVDAGGASPNRPPVSGFIPPTLDLVGTNPETKDRAAHGPRALDRRKRSSEPVFGVQQKFRAISSSDLAFDWNLREESASVLRGRREEIVYGICVSPATMSAGVGFTLILTLLAIIAAVVFYEHICLLTKKTSQLSFLTKNFNGRFEALYRFTRPYLYTESNDCRRQ